MTEFSAVQQTCCSIGDQVRFRWVQKGASSDDLVAAGPARVGVVPARHWDELPLVKARSELELQHTGGTDLLGLHARFIRALLIAAHRTPVPTMNWRMPLAEERLPLGVIRAKRS